MIILKPCHQEVLHSIILDDAYHNLFYEPFPLGFHHFPHQFLSFYFFGVVLGLHLRHMCFPCGRAQALEPMNSVAAAHALSSALRYVRSYFLD